MSRPSLPPDAKRVPIVLTLKQSTKDIARRLADRDGVSVSVLVEDLLISLDKSETGPDRICPEHKA
jgi:hypothetical protein